MNRKEQHELDVFDEFSESWTSAVGVQRESRTPPEPDIFCADGPFGPAFFELSRLTDPAYPRLRSQALKQPPLTQLKLATQPGLAERDVLLTKLSKDYGSLAAPVYLLLYWDDSGLTFSEPPPLGVPFCIVGADLLTPLLRNRMHSFAGVFYFQRRTRRTLWLWRAA